MPTTSTLTVWVPVNILGVGCRLLLIFRNLFIDILETLSDFNATKVDNSSEVSTMDAKCLVSDFVHSF